MMPTAYDPSRFFSHLGNIELEGSPAFLYAQQAYLRDNKTSGLIEIQVNTAKQVILLFAHGVHAGIYLLEDDDNSKPIHMTDLITVWDGARTPIRTLEFPHPVGRMLWLTLESQLSQRLEIAKNEEWDQLSKRWRTERFNGLIEVASETEQGFFYIMDGDALNSETVFYGGQGFETNRPYNQGFKNDAQKVMIHQPFPASQAYQCFILRHGILHWGNEILGRYKALVGQKLVQMIQEKIREVIEPWQWNIFIESTIIRDEHFFPYAETAAHAYRALFMEIGLQIDLVVGSALTNRILNETFEILNKDTRTALETHRLIPAAFSE
jgi:hypothetical protein